VEFGALKVAAMKITVLWVVTPCSMVDFYRLLEENAASFFRVLFYPEDRGVRSRKIFKAY
jgi:hypothetical protein